jgi:hypothetical protein
MMDPNYHDWSAEQLEAAAAALGAFTAHSIGVLKELRSYEGQKNMTSVCDGLASEAQWAAIAAARYAHAAEREREQQAAALMRQQEYARHLAHVIERRAKESGL